MTHNGKYFIVCGSRGDACPDMVNSAMNSVRSKHGEFILICGACPHPSHKRDGSTGFSADMLAIEWAIRNGIKFIGVPADWSKGKAAGPIRNQSMLTLGPSGVIAFPGGVGTADMISRAKRAGVSVWNVK